MILEETYQFLRSNYSARIEGLAITDVRIGLHLTAVKLSDGSYGMASTLEDDHEYCMKPNRDFEDFSPSKIRGRKIIDLFEIPKHTNITRTLRIAVLNAISSTILTEKRYRIIEDTDPIDLVDLSHNKTITLVGAFHSYIRRIAGTGNKLYVLEMNENSLPGENSRYFVPASDYRKVIPVSDIIIITGLTLVNDTIDGLLSAIPPGGQLIVTGPSSSLVPDVLFRYGVNIVGATQVIDGDMLFTIAGEAGAGYHLFQYCARKICILNDTEA
jgi:uncharacterized protein